MAYIRKQPKKVLPEEKCDHPLCNEQGKILVNEEHFLCNKHFIILFQLKKPLYKIKFPKWMKPVSAEFE